MNAARHAAAAARIKISRQSLHAVLAGRGTVTAAMALRFAAVVGGEPRLWLSMQQAFDLWHARRALGPALARISSAT